MCVFVGFAPVTAQGPAAGRPAVTADRTTQSSLLTGTQAAAFTTIQGSALDSLSSPLPNSLVRLRDARFGRIVGSQYTDKAGLFAFGTVDPGSYVVELLAGNRGAVVATSPLLNVGAGELVTTVVKMPFETSPFVAVLGGSAGQALAILSAAAATGVLTTVVANDDASPE
jgi:hypothetical protein